jgi:hypothetical protein
MTHDEYEERKWRIEEQHQLGIELLEAGRRLQRRTLELLWLSGAEDATLRSVPAGISPAPGGTSNPNPGAPTAEVAPPKPKRRPSYQVYTDVVAALASVPEEFTRDAILQVLDYEPDRAALHRILVRLVEEDRILILVERGSGRLPSVYKKAVAETPKPAE